MRPKRASLASYIAAVVPIVCLTILGAAVWHETGEKAKQLKTIETSLGNLVRSLVQHAEDTIQLADVALGTMAQTASADDSFPRDRDTLQALVLRQASELPPVAGLFVFDAAGGWLAGSMPDGTVSLGTERLVELHRTKPGVASELTLPVRDAFSGQWLLTISRRLNGRAGAFAGVAVATIDLDMFENLYGSFDVGRQGSIVLFSMTGHVLARSPYDPAYIGRDVSKASLFTEQFSHRNAGFYGFVSPLDGVQRVAAFQRGERFPVGILVAESEREALGGWRTSAFQRSAVACALVLLISCLGLVLHRAVARLQAARAALAESELNFRLLAENSSDVVARIGSDGRNLYVSPSATQLTGRTPAELTGTLASASFEPADRVAFDAAVAQLRAGDADGTTITHRLRKPDGTEVWLETSLRSVQDGETGTADGVVAVSRNVTRRKMLEDELLHLATTDGLTGLANRREFDERLKSEWHRAARDGSALSLVLFDLDRFKAYNDGYGHRAGDDALLAVANAVRTHARRPADLAARYGGEELALLLPGTDLDGAAVLAGRVRQSVEALSIQHAGNAPFGTVTVSAGVAKAADPRSGRGTPDELVLRADESLYAAKAEGRNRVVVRDVDAPSREGADEAREDRPAAGGYGKAA